MPAVSDSNSSSDEEDVYEVERIVDHKLMRNGKKKYLVHWKGYSTDDDSWETEENLVGCAELLKAYWKQKTIASAKPGASTIISGVATRQQKEQQGEPKPDTGRMRRQLRESASLKSTAMTITGTATRAAIATSAAATLETHATTVEEDHRLEGPGKRRKIDTSVVIKKERSSQQVPESRAGESSWEKSVKSIDEVDKDDKGKLWFLVSWEENKLPSWIPASTAYQKFPQFMLKWYEERIRFKHVD